MPWPRVIHCPTPNLPFSFSSAPARSRRGRKGKRERFIFGALPRATLLGVALPWAGMSSSFQDFGMVRSARDAGDEQYVWDKVIYAKPNS